MKKLFAITALCLLVLAGCAKKEPAATQDPTVPSMSIESGQGEAVVPEEGDIVIPIGD